MEYEIIEGKMFLDVKMASLFSAEGNKYSTDIVKERARAVKHSQSQSYITTDSQSASSS
jgi:hypothetical protein